VATDQILVLGVPHYITLWTSDYAPSLLKKNRNNPPRNPKKISQQL